MTVCMRALRLHAPGELLRLEELAKPQPGVGQVLVHVHACGICRTDLHIVDGELPSIPYPVIPGHEIVGSIAERGTDVTGLSVGDRVGIPWLGHTCGTCHYCNSSRENLCERAGFTGYTRQGGYAEYVVADARFCLPIPGKYSDLEAAPLLCAGLIGYRALRAAGDARTIGLYGFGAAAHLIAQVARAQDKRVLAFTRPGDDAARIFARSLGAVWAGGANETPPELLDAAIIFAPAGELIPQALAATRKAGRVVCAGIHMSDIPSFPYRLLWGERSIVSVANLTRQDGLEFMSLAASMKLDVRAHPVALDEVNDALRALRSGQIEGAAVIHMA